MTALIPASARTASNDAVNCRGHYELSVDADPRRLLSAALVELALAV
ncbi:hypothetical protein [Parafrankia sp. Ea1.12]|nr:hypothetical protein [Parafrankia sp. Ea1.12]